MVFSSSSLFICWVKIVPSWYGKIFGELKVVCGERASLTHWLLLSSSTKRVCKSVASSYSHPTAKEGCFGQDCVRGHARTTELIIFYLWSALFFLVQLYCPEGMLQLGIICGVHHLLAVSPLWLGIFHRVWWPQVFVWFVIFSTVWYNLYFRKNENVLDKSLPSGRFVGCTHRASTPLVWLLVFAPTVSMNNQRCVDFLQICPGFRDNTRKHGSLWQTLSILSPLGLGSRKVWFGIKTNP